MTVLENEIHIQTSPEKVWSVLASLDSLDKYDPGVKKSTIVSSARNGMGAERRCDLAPGGWFRERVTDWSPHRAMAFELCECTLPVRRLKHSYRIAESGSGTVVSQRMEYELKFGPLGWLMDALMVRKKWDAGIKSFMKGLKRFAEEAR